MTETIKTLPSRILLTSFLAPCQPHACPSSAALALSIIRLPVRPDRVDSPA